MAIYTGETIQLAIEKGLKAQNISEADAQINVISNGKKGFFGIGKKEVEVQIEPREAIQINENLVEKSVEKQEEINRVQKEQLNKEKSNSDKSLDDDEAIKEVCLYLTQITKAMDVAAAVKVERENQVITFNLDTEKQGLLIGKHGKILNALQYLGQIFMHRIASNRLSIVVNVGDYREKRVEVLKHLAEKTSHQVEETGRSVFLDPMPAFERKQIHFFLSGNPYVKTYSEGEEPFRYLVVEPSKNMI